MKPLSLKPGDILETPGYTCRHLYHVAGVFLGGLNQESLVHLAPIDQTEGSTAKCPGHPAYVPLHMIEAGVASGLFTLTRPEDAA